MASEIGHLCRMRQGIIKESVRQRADNGKSEKGLTSCETDRAQIGTE